MDNVSYELVEDALQVDGQQFELVCERLEFEFVDNYPSFFVDNNLYYDNNVSLSLWIKM